MSISTSSNPLAAKSAELFNRFNAEGTLPGAKPIPMEAGFGFEFLQVYAYDHPSRVEPLLVQQGDGLAIAPSGGSTPDQLRVPAFHVGTAAFAIQGGAEYVTPITFYYHPDREARPLEKLLGTAAAALATAFGLTVLACGSPTVAATAAVTGAVLGGAALAQSVAGRLDPPSLWSRAFQKLAANACALVAGGMAGAAAAVTAISLGSASSVPLVLAAGVLAGGLGVKRLAHGWSTRDVADMVVDDGIAVAPYAQCPDRHHAIDRLTEQLHSTIGQTKSRLTGVPYDDRAVKILRTQHFNDPHPIGSPLGD